MRKPGARYNLIFIGMAPATRLSPTARLRCALQLRCPACGSRGMVVRWVHFADRCPACGLRPDRGEADHFLGGYVLNLGVAEFIAAALWASVLAFSWPDPPWELMQWSAAALVVLTPLVLYPFTRLLFLAIDLIAQPRRPGDFGVEDPTYR